MGRARASIDLPAPASLAESVWYDPRRWPSFVDGLAVVRAVESGWPEAGGRIVWDTRGDGRGRVVEAVRAYRAREGQTAEVEDAAIRGTQRVTFTPTASGCTLALELEYTQKEPRGPAWLVDLLWVRRLQRESLQRTLRRFGREIGDELHPPL